MRYSTRWVAAGFRTRWVGGRGDMRQGTAPTAILLLLWASGPVRGATPAQPPQAVHSQYGSAKSCGVCHDTIHKNWDDSVHARASTNPVFLETLRRMVAGDGATEASKGARDGCVWCHAPTTLLAPDSELKPGISQEGVTCDFCQDRKSVV